MLWHLCLLAEPNFEVFHHLSLKLSVVDLSGEAGQTGVHMLGPFSLFPCSKMCISHSILASKTFVRESKVNLSYFLFFITNIKIHTESYIQKKDLKSPVISMSFAPHHKPNNSLNIDLQSFNLDGSEWEKKTKVSFTQVTFWSQVTALDVVMSPATPKSHTHFNIIQISNHSCDQRESADPNTEKSDCAPLCNPWR